MTTINLKDFYYWYTQDQFIEVSDEVAGVFLVDTRYEMAYQRRLSRHKAQYSLDCEDGIEYSACLHEPTPPRALGADGAVLPSVERPQFSAGDPGPEDRRPHHSRKERQGNCRGRGRT